MATNGWDEESIKKVKEKIAGARKTSILGNLVQMRAKGSTNPRDRGMNKTEAKYARYLEQEKQAGRIADYWFEAWKIRIADNCTWLPDFVVIDCDGFLSWRDTKVWWAKAGKVGITEDANVKMKAVAEKYPQVRVIATWEREDVWHEMEF